jgi:hypothetical protein
MCDFWFDGEHRSGPVALIDGATDVPYSVGKDAEGNPVRALDLPLRVKVVLPDGHAPGKWIVDAYLGADARAGPAGETDSTRVAFIDGEAWLWLPRGPALIVARRDGAIVSQWRIDVSGAAVQELVVDEGAMGTARIAVVSDDPALGAPDKGWVYEVVAADGQTLDVVGGEELHLQAGSYALLPPANKLAASVRFTVIAGQTVTATIRVLAEVHFDGRLILSLPAAGAVMTANFWYEIDRHPDKPLASGTTMFTMDGDWLFNRQVPQGQMLYDLPRGREFWLAGALNVGEQRHAMIPMRVTLGGETPVVQPQWRPMRPAPDWNTGGYCVCWQTPSGPCVRTDRADGGRKWWDCQPTGRCTMTLRRESGEVLLSFETSHEPADAPALMPPELIARLRELGAMR